MIRAFGFLLLIFFFAAPLRAAEPPDPFELRALLTSGNFAELERLITDTQARIEAGTADEADLIDLLAAFATSDPALNEPLERWNAALPASFAAPLARAHYHFRLGWLVRQSQKDDQDAPNAHFRQALDDAFKALELGPRVAPAYGLLIDLDLAHGGGRSRSVMEDGLAVLPESYLIRFQYLAGLTLWWGGSPQDIEAFLETHVRPAADQEKLATLYGFPAFNQAETLMRQGRPNQAIAAYDKALEFGEQSWFLDNRGRAYLALGLLDQALADFERYLTIWPWDAQVLDSRAQIKLRQGETDQALADWALALRLDPLDPILLRHRAFALERLGRLDQAWADLEQALAFHAADDGLRAWRGRFLLDHRQDFAGAAAELARALELAPERADYWHVYAYALYQQGDCAAVPALTRYLALCPPGPDCPVSALADAKRTLQSLQAGQCKGE